ncbi:L-type lectin-domain containing receptor kinase VII.1-like [Hibiscus syriacus]|uniref:L-type lectin-domain containing receptor kinase VII.1-like n=1 Tax=Hibiscus syriacus TaxID=106335 RepID=A0A6A2ZFG2_HIBSY|nr:L-type lectin-domain containing receptor kinase VII.1-like [Hibiscus syriacus]
MGFRVLLMLMLLSMATAIDEPSITTVNRAAYDDYVHFESCRGNNISESKRRVLLTRTKHIGYCVLNARYILCRKRGVSYYNC